MKRPQFSLRLMLLVVTLVVLLWALRVNSVMVKKIELEQIYQKEHPTEFQR
jgi:hypothetical protein